MSKMGIVQKTLIGVNLLSLIVLASGVAVATTKNHTKAAEGYNYTWKQTACRVVVFHSSANLPRSGDPSFNRELYLGPAQWTASYIINGKQINEVWTANDWKNASDPYLRWIQGSNVKILINTSDFEYKTIENNNCSDFQSYIGEGGWGILTINANRNYHVDSIISTGQYGFKLNAMVGTSLYTQVGSSIPQGWDVSSTY